MKKSDFITLLLTTLGTLVFGLGMCMALITEWNLFNQGIICGGIGLIILLITVIVRRKMSGKKAIKLSAKTIGITLYSTMSVLVFGTGMCMTMLRSEYMIQGILVGIVGIGLLLGLIPMTKGLK